MLACAGRIPGAVPAHGRQGLTNATRTDADTAFDVVAALGPPAQSYVTDPGNGAAFAAGPKAAELSRSIAAVLAARGGNAAAPDDRLAMVARQLLSRATRSRNADANAFPNSTAANAAATAAAASATASDVEHMAHHLGFAGSVWSASAFSLDVAATRETWRESLSEIAPNFPINRYGLWVSGGGDAAAVVLGDMSLTLEPVPRHLPRGSKVRLRGELASRFEFGHAYVTYPDGTVRETPFAKRRFDVTVALPARGIYRVEVMGDGATGPTIVMNVPIYVDVEENVRLSENAGANAWNGEGVGRNGARPADSSRATPAGDWQSPALFEARLLELLNAARAKAGLGGLQADDQLRAVAARHSQDMERAPFFGHVSPTTGTVVERLQRAGVQVALAGENLSQAANPDEAHQGLMESPGHRANMLAPKFTHVGIGVMRRPGPASPTRFLATLVFARRTPPGRRFAATDAVAAIAASRKGKGMAPVTIDAQLRAGAEAGMTNFAETGLASEAAAAASAAYAKASARQPAHTGKGAVCALFFEILDPEQLDAIPVLTDPRLLRIGLAVHARNDGGVPKFAVLVLSDGVGCDGR